MAPPASLDGERVRELLFDLSPDAVLVFRAGIVAHANPAAVELLRAPSEESLVGVPSRTLIHPDSHPTVERNVRAIEAGARVTRSEEKYLRLDGSTVEVEVSAARATFYGGRGFVVILRDISDRRELAQRREREVEALRSSVEARAREQWLREIFDCLPVGVFARDADDRFVLVNRACAALLERRADELLGRTAIDAGCAEFAFFAGDDAVRSLPPGTPLRLPEVELPSGGGRQRILQATKLHAELGGRPLVLGVIDDLTEQRSLQQQLFHSQKMESLGRLAGGIAHDFNNMLTVIIESCDHLDGLVPEHRQDLASTREAATRAASLTRRLLAFSRQSDGRPRTLVFDELLEQMGRLLQRVLGEDVELLIELGAPNALVRVESEQFELVLVNLAVNARDAMPSGGTLVLETALVERAQGPRLRLEVRDSGVGMDEPTRMRALEPFFTTKGEGIGTGLGLSTCLGVVQQSGGEMEIASEVGRGTTVRILLPLCEARSLQPPAGAAPPSVSTTKAAATVLMVEDDPLVRRATQRILRTLGYSVLTAALPSEALALAREHAGPIDLLLTDVVMPGQNGPDVARAFSELRPSAAVVFVSGHSANAFDAGTNDLHNFLRKPFTRDELAETLREALEERAVFR